MSVELKDYVFKKISYDTNKNFNVESSEIEFIPDIDFKYYLDDEKKAFALRIGLKEGKITEKTPFLLRLDLLGFFEFQGEYNKKLEIEAASILFPYLRNQVSVLTLNSNEFPPYFLPTIDLKEELSKNDNISRVDSEFKI